MTGLVQAIVRRGSLRVSGALAFAVFCFVGLVHASWLLRRPPSGLGHLRIGTVDVDETEMPAFLLTYLTSGRVMILVPMAAIGLAGAIVAATSHGGSSHGTRVLGLAVAILFGGAGLMGLATFRRPQGIALTHSGLAFLSLRRPKLVGWDSISEVGTHHLRFDIMHLQRWVGIRLHPPNDPAVKRRIKRFNRRLLGWDQSIPAEWLSIDPEVLERVIRHYVDAPDVRRTIGSESGLEQLRAAVFAA